MAIETIFLCFCQDCEVNDGIDKPYFMTKGMLEFVRVSYHLMPNYALDDTTLVHVIGTRSVMDSTERRNKHTRLI